VTGPWPGPGCTTWSCGAAILRARGPPRWPPVEDAEIARLKKQDMPPDPSSNINYNPMLGFIHNTKMALIKKIASELLLQEGNDANDTQIDENDARVLSDIISRRTDSLGSPKSKPSSPVAAQEARPNTGIDTGHIVIGLLCITVLIMGFLLAPQDYCAAGMI